jgi:hypothetical protein
MRDTIAVSRSCSVVDSIDCEDPQSGGTGPIVSCWACGDDVCRGCSSVISYQWRGQLRRIRFCFRCQDERRVGRAAERKAS